MTVTNNVIVLDVLVKFEGLSSVSMRPIFVFIQWFMIFSPTKMATFQSLAVGMKALLGLFPIRSLLIVKGWS